MNLLERDELLAQLQELERRAAEQGQFAVVEGEAGIGKTALLRSFAQLRGGSAWWGECDALQTPRPLGPLHDIAAQAGGALGAALRGEADRALVFNAFLEALATRPMLVVVEDVHWADEATLDWLRHAARRIGRTRALLVATCRDDELGPDHPFRILLGDLASGGVHRFAPPALTVDAVRCLAKGLDVDVDALHRGTGGNPFFVTEVLAAGAAGVPPTVRDAVLARAARLRPSARAMLDAVAVAGPRVDPWLLNDVVGAEADALSECRSAGVLAADAGAIVFRHELARRAVLDAMSPTRLQALHTLVLRAIQARGATAADPARLAHHAEAAGQVDVVPALALDAALHAAAMGAHRQAAEQYARALRHTTAGAQQRAELHDAHASELHLTGALDAAIEARRRAIGLWHRCERPHHEALALARLAHALVVLGRNAEADAALAQAFVLIGDEASPETVATRRWAAYLRMLDRDVETAIADGEAAMAAAERLGDRETVIQCLNTIGSSMIVAGQVDAGVARLERSLALAENDRLDFHRANALGNLGSACGEVFRFDLAQRFLERGIAFALEHDLDNARLYDLSWLALVQLYRGDWSAAALTARLVLDSRAAIGIARIMALLAIGRLRARRGDPNVWTALDEAQRLATQTNTLQRIAPVQAARAEAAWLEGDADRAAQEARVALPLAQHKRHAWFSTELAFWLRRADPRAAIGALPRGCDTLPFGLESSGDWREAAAAWRALGCPFETARAIAGGDEAAQREALAIFEGLGARPMVERVRRQLRASGVRGLPRGPREATLGHPGRLTGKEARVLALLATGLRNKEIALRLSRSTRTIDHHVAAIFAKLGVANRAEAVSAAHRLGIAATDEPR